MEALILRTEAMYKFYLVIGDRTDSAQLESKNSSKVN